jgi:hypothetical protein
MAIMCEECKCSIYLDDNTGDYGGCESGCPCCNQNLNELIAIRAAQVLAITDEDRAAGDETNPIIFAESGPNRFNVMTLFFEDKPGGINDGVTIEEHLGSNDITVKYFTDDNTTEITSGPVYEWAINQYKENF